MISKMTTMGEKSIGMGSILLKMERTGAIKGSVRSTRRRVQGSLPTG